jgi:hypothetical protein
MIGARAMGMGGFGTAISTDATALIWNPANLGLSKNKFNLNTEFADLYSFYNYSFFGATSEIRDRLNAGIGFIYSGDEAMSETTFLISTSYTDNFFYEYFDIVDDAVNIGATLKILYSSFGNNKDGSFISESGLNHQISGSSIGCAFDFGFTFKANEKNYLSVVGKNALSILGWESKNEVNTAKGNYTENLPTQLLLGYARCDDNVTFVFNLDQSLYRDTETYFSFGCEYLIIEKIMALRAGFSREAFTTPENLKYSFGTGFKIPFEESNINVDMAYQLNSYSAWNKFNTFHISLGYGF